MIRTLAAVCVLVTVGGVLGAGCTGDDEAREADRGEPIGEAEEPQITEVARVTCALATALIVAHVCVKTDFWPKYCAEGTRKIVRDVWTKQQVSISCDTLKEITCGSGAFAADHLAAALFCGKVF